jgi:hypothetical protein
LSSAVSRHRPSFEEASAFLTTLLASRHRPTDIEWVLGGQFVISASDPPPAPVTVRLYTRVEPPDRDLARCAYDLASATDRPVVIRVIGTYRGQTVATILSDEWFESADEHDGYILRPEWGLLFGIGDGGELEQTRRVSPWAKLRRRFYPVLSDFDFAVTLQAARDFQQFGRVLAGWERILQRRRISGRYVRRTT